MPDSSRSGLHVAAAHSGPETHPPQDDFSPESRAHAIRQVGNVVEYYATLALSLSVYTVFCMLPEGLHDLGYLSALGCWVLFYLSKIVRIVMKFTSDASGGKKCHMRKSLAAFLLIIATLVFMALKELGVSFATSYTVCAPLLASYCLNLLCFRETGAHCLNILLATKIIVSFFRLVGLFMVLLRSEERTDGNWVSTVWYVQIRYANLRVGRCGSGSRCSTCRP